MDAWVLWVVVGFHWFFGSFVCLSSSWFWYMQGSGRLGGGKEVLDVRSCPIAKAVKFRIVKVGDMHMQPADNGDVIIFKKPWLMGKVTPVRIKKDQMKTFDQEHFILCGPNGEGLGSVNGLEMMNYNENLAFLKNKIGFLGSELTKKFAHEREIVEFHAKMTKTLAEATMRSFGGSSKSDKK